MTANTSPQNTPKASLKVMAILHLAFTVMPLIFSLVILIVINNYSIFNFENIDLIYYLFPLIAMTVVYLSSIVFNNLLTKIERTHSLQEKLNKYQTASIIKYAMLEGSAILCIVTALITAHVIFIGIAWAIIAYLYLQKPTGDIVIKDLALNMTERKALSA
jgi:hypothetical protein